MATSRILKVEDWGHKAGNQLKLFVQLEGGQWCMFKPRWYEKDKIVDNDTSCLTKDIHTSEIAAFHMSR